VNFLLYDPSGAELKLADDMTLFGGTVTRTCLDTVSELADAIIFSESELKKQALMLRLLENVISAFESHSKGYHTIKRGVKLLMDEWNQNQRIERYADACGISESSFYSIFKEWSGCSPIEYRNRIRIAAARSMLENTNLQISEIAFAVGFEDPYYFSRFFKKETGASPRAFRNG
jgi:AraC-like DNA-binding protein